MKTSYLLTRLFFLGTLLLFGAGCIKIGPFSDYFQSRGAAFRARSNISGTIRVKLVNELGEAIANKSVKIESDNGIRCIQAPCPTEYREWIGTSDAQGFVVVPAKVINVFTTITVDGYSAKDLNRDSKKTTAREWEVVL